MYSRVSAPHQVHEIWYPKGGGGIVLIYIQWWENRNLYSIGLLPTTYIVAYNATPLAS